MNEPRSILRALGRLSLLAGLAAGCGSPPEGLPDPGAIDAEPQVEQRIQEATDDVRRDPSSAASWGRLGEIYDLHRFAEQALACYARASELDPQEWRWPYFSGLVLRETDQAASIAKLERALELKPDYAPARFYLGMGYLLSERLDEAAREFERAASLDPRMANALIGRARVDLARGAPEAALERLLAAARVAPGEAAVHHNLALGYRALGRDDEAEREEARAAASPAPLQVADLGSLTDPVRDEAILREGVGSSWLLQNASRLRSVGQDGPALEMLGRVLELDPQSVPALLEAARIHIARGDPAQGRALVERVLAIDPGSAAAHVELGNALTRLEQNDAAIAEFERAIEIDPSLGEAQNNLATLLFGMGRADEGLERLRAAAARLPGEAGVQYNLAAVLLNRERYDEAVDVLRASLALRPDATQNLYLLSSVLAMRGEFDEAAELLAQVVEREPRHLDARLDLAQAQWELSRYAEAVHTLEETHAAAPDDPAVSFRLAWALATCPSDDARDGEEALALARSLNEKTQFGDPRLLDLLAAAQAETGDFDSAGASARRAVTILDNVLRSSPPAGADERAAAEAFTNEVRDRARLYTERRAYRDR